MRAVIVTTDTDTLADVRRAWEANGVRTSVLTPADDACGALNGSIPDLVLLHGALPRSTVEGVYGTLRRHGDGPPTPILFSRASVAPAASSGADYVLPHDARSRDIAAFGQRVLGIDGARATGEARNGTATATATEHRTGRRAGRSGAALGRVRAARGPTRAPGQAVGAPVGADRPSVSAPTARRASRASDVTLGRFLLRWSWVLVLTMVLGAAGGWAFLQYGPVQYQSRALLTVRPQLDPSGEPIVSTNPARYQATVQALAGQAASPAVYETTSRILAPFLTISGDEIAALVQAGRIQVAPVGGSSYVSVTATDTDPQRAWLLADGYARGLLEDLTSQTRAVGDRRRVELTTQIDVLQQQLAAVPLNFNSPGPAQTFSSVHANLLESLVQAQVRLRMLSQVEAPLMRYGETDAPVQSTSPSRVLVAGAAVGLAAGLGLAYCFELLRQWARRRRPTRSVAVKAVPKSKSPPAAATVPNRGEREPDSIPHDAQREARPWAESASL